MSTNRRIFYATQAVGMAPLGSNNYTVVHGADSLGVNTNFTLDQILELGQISLYQLVEQVPEIEVTLSKVLDGYPLLYHLATQGAPNATLVGRSNQRAMVATSIYSDVQQSASGAPQSQMVCSGMYFSQISYTFGTDGVFKENLSLVGNNRYWLQSGYTFTPTFTNSDTPMALSGSGGVNLRQHFIFAPTLASGARGYAQERTSTLDANGQLYAFLTILPPDIPGISTSGTNNKDATGAFGAHILSVTTSTNIGRDAILELGRKEPYFRFANFPVEVNTEITVTSSIGDLVNATELGVTGDGNNLTARTIKLRALEGTFIDLGLNNKLSSVSYGGGDTGGGQVNVTYSYRTYNDFTVTHPADPSNLPYPY